MHATNSRSSAAEQDNYALACPPDKAETSATTDATTTVAMPVTGATTLTKYSVTLVLGFARTDTSRRSDNTGLKDAHIRSPAISAPGPSVFWLP